MRIAGFKKQSFIDFPGNISSVIFTQGCNFRCGFCHNPNLVLPEKFEKSISQIRIFDYLKRYSHLLDAVCITGGEPTIHHDLPDLITDIKSLGLKVKLDSNGTNPQMLKMLIANRLIDAVAMDIKHLLTFDLYYKTTGNFISRNLFSDILNSVNLIQTSGIPYEFRTTVAKGLHSIEQIQSLKRQFGDNYVLQNFKPGNILDPEFEYEPFSDEEFNLINSSDFA